jgi:signal transduction histidine kinase
MHLNPHTILPIVCLFLTLSCGIFVLSQNPQAHLNRLFFFICLTMAAWFSIYIPFNFSVSEKNLILWFRISFCFISFLPIMIFTFITTYLNMPKNIFWYRINSMIGLLICLINIFTDWIIKGINYLPWYPYPKAGKAHFLLVFYCIYLGFSGIQLILKAMKNPRISAKNLNHTRYLLIAAIVTSTSILDFIGNYNIYLYSIGPLCSTIFLLIIGVAVVKHQLMDIKVIIKRSLVYTLLITVITMFYLISIFLAEHTLQSMLGYKSLVVSMASATFIALAFIPLRNFIQNLIEKTLFRGSYMQITEENELLRQEIAQSEHMKSIAILASGMAHEIKNPLTPIKTFSEQLPFRLDDKEFLLKFSKIINKEVDRIDSLVQELLNFAKPSPPELKKVNIHQLIAQTLDLLNNEIIRHKINLNTSFENKNILINIDPQQIKQALLNIFLNAIDAMPNGGRLDVNVNEVQQTKLMVTISDSGCGIASKDLPHIFDPFFTKKDHGTGLGLSITHEIIKNHNGRILTESELGKGTTFRIELPL